MALSNRPVPDSGVLFLNLHVLPLFQHLRGPGGAAKHLPDRGAALAAGGDHRGDPEELHLLLLLGALHYGPLPEHQGPRGQRRVRLGPQLLVALLPRSSTPHRKHLAACTHTLVDPHGAQLGPHDFLFM